jgi:hypothetical protein
VATDLAGFHTSNQFKNSKLDFFLICWLIAGDRNNELAGGI